MKKPLVLTMLIATMSTSAIEGAASQQSSKGLRETVDVSVGSSPFQEAVRAFLEGSRKKIVGGQPAVEGQLPWQVSLGVSWIADSADAHFCGGSVYSEKWIVTAAHCVDGNTADSIVVSAGVIDLRLPAQRKNVARILVNDQYVNADSGDDVALLELFSPLSIDKNTTSIALLTPDSEGAILTPDAQLTTSGFGYTKENGAVSAKLNFVEVPYVETERCNEPLSYDGAITSEMICAGETEGGKDSCQGDSGGPLIVHTKDGKPLLAGIVSWGEGCARPLKFGIYTRVTQYLQWIDACVAGQPQCTLK